jgi:RND family efflux transporter MFP subunit
MLVEWTGAAYHPARTGRRGHPVSAAWPGCAPLQRSRESGLRRIEVLAVLALLAGCGSGTPPPPPPPVVDVARPIQRSVVDWDDYVGRFEAIQTVELKPRIDGQIVEIGFRSGQDVPRGTVLFRLDPRPAQAALEQARAQVQRARATLANAQQERDRAMRLLVAQAISREESEQKEAAARTAKADVAAAEAAANQASLNLSFTTIRAPVDGRVSDRRVSVGDQVSSNDTVLTTVVSLDPIWFTFEGAEAFYLKYARQDAAGGRVSSRRTANPVEIQLADEQGYNWKGRMSFVDNAIDPTTGTIRAHATVRNPAHFLTPGMFGRVRLLGSSTYQALLVPDEAVVTDQARHLIYVAKPDGKIVGRPVELGPLVEGLRVVREGLAPTDQVVLAGLATLRPDSVIKAHVIRLKPRASDTSPTPPPNIAPPSAEATPAGSR